MNFLKKLFSSKIPKIKIPEVKIPEIKIPEVKIPEVKIPVPTPTPAAAETPVAPPVSSEVPKVKSREKVLSSFKWRAESLAGNENWALMDFLDWLDEEIEGFEDESISNAEITRQMVAKIDEIFAAYDPEEHCHDTPELVERLKEIMGEVLG